DVRSVSGSDEDDEDDEEEEQFAKVGSENNAASTGLGQLQGEDDNEVAVVDGSPLRKKTLILKPSRTLSNPIGNDGGCVSPGSGGRLSSSLGSTNNGYGTGGASYS